MTGIAKDRNVMVKNLGGTFTGATRSGWQLSEQEKDYFADDFVISHDFYNFDMNPKATNEKEDGEDRVSNHLPNQNRHHAYDSDFANYNGCLVNQDGFLLLNKPEAMKMMRNFVDQIDMCCRQLALAV